MDSRSFGALNKPSRQNTSHAVMAQRKEPHDSLDFFPTPLWATRALVEHVLIGNGWRRDQLASMGCWEPACGQGHMAIPLLEYFAGVIHSDVHDYGVGAKQIDFLMPGKSPVGVAHWIISNPPFKLAEEFALRSIDLAHVGSAMLVRSTFLEGIGRYERLFSKHPPAIVAPFVERVPMVKGRVDAKATTATAYTWLVWSKLPHHAWRTVVQWIPPCRKQLERPEDYQLWGDSE